MIVVGIAAIAVIVASVVGYVGDLHRVEAGGDGEVIALDEGGYTVYVEDTPTGPVSDRLHISAPDGAVVDERPYDGSYSYHDDDRRGVAAVTFHADEDGEYRVRLARGEPSGPVDAVYIGPGFGRHVGASIVRGIVVGLIGSMLAVAATIALAVARGRSRRRGIAVHGI